MYSQIGRSTARIDAPKFAIGKAKFGADINLRHMLYGKILRSRHPHALILTIDTSRAEALPGVRAVVTAKDTPNIKYGSLIKDQSLFARDRVRCLGDALAAVAAVDEETAVEALELIRVDYEPLPVVSDPVKAMEADAPLVHPDLENYYCWDKIERRGNMCLHIKLRSGDIQAGFEKSDFIFEDTFKTQMVHQGYLEPHASVATVEAGKITVWTSTQTPFLIRSALADTLQIPLSNIRVIGTSIGGGFGGKEVLLAEPSCVLLSQKTGRPVKIVTTVAEDFTSSNPRHPCISELKTGVMKDGTLVARQAKLIFDTGAYTGGGPLVTSSGMLLICGPYRIPNVAVDGYWAYTNKMNCGSCRCPGNPQVTFAYESHMDIIAEKLGIDPLEFRLKNAFRDGDTTSTGQVYTQVILDDTLRTAAERIGWGKANSDRSGKGMACGQWGSARGSSSASIKVNEDGSIIISTGAVELGTGFNTVLAMIAAEELGLRIEDVVVTSADTETTPFDYGSFGSRATFNVGNAVRRAVYEVKNQLLALASAKLEADVDDLEIGDRQVFVKGAPQRGVSLNELARTAHFAVGGPILGRGSFIADRPYFDSTTITNDYQATLMAPAFITEAAEVRVDSDTGQVDVLQLAVAQDVGFAINPLAVEGQIEGGIVQGLGFALTEEFKFDGGVLVNPDFLAYKIPTAVDVPLIQAAIVESEDSDGPFRAKGVGEPPITPTAAAIANAVQAAAGVRIRELPITAERVLAALKQNQRTD